MANQAMMCGLRLEPSRFKFVWDVEALKEREPTKSLKRSWWLLEYLPLKRLDDGKAGEHTRSAWSLLHAIRYSLFCSKPHFGEGRAMLPHQLIHVSVALKHRDYRPFAKLLGHDWKDLVGKTDEDLANLDQTKWDLDIYDHSDTQILLDRLENGDEQVFILKRILFRARSGLCHLSYVHTLSDHQFDV
jgi:hypothetical protein